MSLNRIYVGLPGDLNIRNGKTSSAVYDIVKLWQASELSGKPRTIFSNIKLKNIPYEQFTPENIEEVLETENAMVLFDELHTIVHKKHTVSEQCQLHTIPGLCYKISEFLRQVGKRHIDTYSTCQTYADAQYQLRVMMNIQVYCQMGNTNNGYWKKCDPLSYIEQECPSWHHHVVRQRRFPTSEPWKHYDVEVSRVFDLYDSWEIVKGWLEIDTDYDEPRRPRQRKRLQ